MTKPQSHEDLVDIWHQAFSFVFRFCVPIEVRKDVLKLLHSEEPAKMINFENITFDRRNFSASEHARSLMIQVLVRSITNTNSASDASRILLQQHGSGAGSGNLADYLDGLPGIVVKPPAGSSQP